MIIRSIVREAIKNARGWKSVHFSIYSKARAAALNMFKKRESVDLPNVKWAWSLKVKP